MLKCYGIYVFAGAHIMGSLCLQCHFRNVLGSLVLSGQKR